MSSDPTPDLSVLLEAKIRDKIAKLESEFMIKRDSMLAMLEGTRHRDADLQWPAPYRIYGIDSNELDSITIQIGTLTVVLMQILELRKGLAT